jgi:hypothetical protein
MIRPPADERRSLGPGRKCRKAQQRREGIGARGKARRCDQGADSVRLLASALNRSIGIGKTIVELLSPAILARVCK